MLQAKIPVETLIIWPQFSTFCRLCFEQLVLCLRTIHCAENFLIFSGLFLNAGGNKMTPQAMCTVFAYKPKFE